MVLRFVDNNFNIKEDFINFIHYKKGLTGADLASIILKYLEKHSLVIQNCRQGQFLVKKMVVLSIFCYQITKLFSPFKLSYLHFVCYIRCKKYFRSQKGYFILLQSISATSAIFLRKVSIKKLN